MDNFATEQDWIMSCNLHPKRWKARRKQTASDKEIIGLYKELRSLWHIISNMEYEELEVPIQRGYKRHFELSKSIKWGDEANFFQGILNKINIVQYSKDKQFKKVRSRRLGKYKYRKRGNPMLLDLTEQQFKTLGEKEKWYFYPIETYYSNTKLWITRYRFIEPWRFEIRIRPNMLTKIQKCNWNAERRKDEIESYLETNKLYVKTEKTRRAYRYWLRDEWYYRPPLENPLQNKPLHKVMEEYNEEKQLWAYNQKN
ncbi:MAG: hypothetical protein LBV43_06820 [Prevotella sp.]|jgi:hypothetical protein|nr:hypothetical protein [Prevotella sp.]